MLRRRKPGDTRATVDSPARCARELTIAIAEDPRLQLVPVETPDGSLTPRSARSASAWLGSKQ